MPRQIYLFSPVMTGTAESFIRQLLDYDRESNEEITVFINSPGGSVTSLFAMVDVMKACRSSIRTVVVGMAASAAAVIASCGDKRLITENSEVMIHEVLSFSFGSVSQVEEDMKRVKEMQERLLGILSRNTKKPIDELRSMVKKTDKYFSAKEAVRMGLADTVIGKNEAQVLKLSDGFNTEGMEIVVADKGLSEIQLLKEGTYQHPAYGTLSIDEQVMEQMVKNFKDGVRGIDISIDYTHDNESGEKPAACWIKDIAVVGETGKRGLFAKVEFTPKGKELILQKEYRYASADFSINYVTESGKYVPYVLRGGTLTNRPFIKEMNPIKLSEHKPKEENEEMNKEQLIAALQEHGVNVLEMEQSLQNVTTENASLKAQIGELNTLKEDNEKLQAKLKDINASMVASEKEKAFNNLVLSGKLVPAQKTVVMNTFSSAKSIEEFYAEAPVIVKTKEVGSNGSNSDELTAEEVAAVASGEVTKEDVIANRRLK